jgi:hypothetical protein
MRSLQGRVARLRLDALNPSTNRMETIRMERPRIVGIVLYGLALGLMGCASDQARYVYQDRESGVIAIPRNTPKMMVYAEALMEKHFPDKNYDVVRTVEVETGGSRSTYESDVTDAATTPLRSGVLSAVKFRHERDRKQAESTKLSECRIVYHKHFPGGRAGLAFAESPEYTPKVYSDAVAEDLLGVTKKTTQLAKARTKNTKDDAVQPTAGPIKALSPPNLGGKGE